MKRLIAAILLAAGPLQAQVGAAAANASSAGKGNHWQNWVFASSALVTAAAAVVVIAVDNGTQAH